MQKVSYDGKIKRRRVHLSMTNSDDTWPSNDVTDTAIFLKINILFDIKAFFKRSDSCCLVFSLSSLQVSP